MNTEEDIREALDAHDRRKNEHAGSIEDARRWTAKRARLLTELDRARGHYAPPTAERAANKEQGT